MIELLIYLFFELLFKQGFPVFVNVFKVVFRGFNYFKLFHIAESFRRRLKYACTYTCAERCAGASIIFVKLDRYAGCINKYFGKKVANKQVGFPCTYYRWVHPVFA